MNQTSGSNVTTAGGIGPDRPPAYRVGDLLVLTGTQQVFRDDKEIPLPKLSFDLLDALIQAAPNTLGPDELMRRVWPGLVISAETVTQRVKLLRDALGDDRQAPRYVGLVRGRGYRMLAPVQPGSAGRAEESAPPARRASRRWVVWGLSGLLLLAALAGIFRQQLSETPAADPSVAVLPFATLSPDAQAQDYFAAGMHDDLLTRLAQIDGLRVISRGSVLGYRDSPKSMREIARELGVAHLLEGSVQQIGDRVRINVQLIDAATDTHLWAQTFDRELSVANMLDIQADIAAAIAASLRIALQADGDRAPATPVTENLEAYRLYLTGNGYRQRWFNEGAPDQLLIAEDHFRRALAIDPEFALAHAALARVLAEIHWQQARPTVDSTNEDVRAAAQRALQLAPELPEAHLALANYWYYGHRDYEQALQEIARAEARMPGGSDIHLTKLNILRRLGRLDEFVQACEQALQFAPRDILLSRFLAAGLLRQGRLDAADDVLRRLQAIDPDSWQSRLGLAATQYLRTGDQGELRAVAAQHAAAMPEMAWQLAWTAGDYAAARAAIAGMPDDLGGDLPPRALLQALIDLEDGEPARARAGLRQLRSRLEAALAESVSAFPEKHLQWLALTLAALGEREAAIAAGREAARLLPVTKDGFIGPAVALNLALVYAAFAEKELAIAALEQAVSQPFGPLPWLWQNDPRLDPLRGETGFLALVERYGAPFEAPGTGGPARPAPD